MESKFANLSEKAPNIMDKGFVKNPRSGFLLQQI